jgi:hypothetical protein
MENRQKMQKTKTKVSKSTTKPKEQEVFRRCLSCEMYKSWYKEVEEFNYSLIDDLCYATERIEKLENGFIKGIIVGGVIVGIVWLISL